MGFFQTGHNVLPSYGRHFRSALFGVIVYRQIYPKLLMSYYCVNTNFQNGLLEMLMYVCLFSVDIDVCHALQKSLQIFH